MIIKIILPFLRKISVSIYQKIGTFGEFLLKATFIKLSTLVIWLSTWNSNFGLFLTTTLLKSISNFFHDQLQLKVGFLIVFNIKAQESNY